MGRKLAYTKEELYNEFELRGLTLLPGQYYRGSKHKYKYIGRCGHEVEALFNQVKNGKNLNCKKCARESVNQHWARPVKRIK